MITGVDAESIVWPENAPTREEHLRRKEGVDEAQQRLDALRAYQTDVLGAARDRLSDPDNLPNREELAGILKDISKGMPGISQAAAPATENEASVAKPSSFEVDVPKF